MKKFFIKICKLFGFEIIDQNEFISPTLNKELNKDLSILNKKSIVLPLGEVKITRKVNSILIIVRVNTEIEVWDQNKRRLFEKPKIDYSIRSIKSLIKSINLCQKKYSDLKIKTIVLDDSSKDENLGKIKQIIKDVDCEIISLDTKKFETKIKKQKSQETFSNLASLFQSFEIGKKIGEDLIFFIEDDYLHFETMLDEMISTYERVSSQVGKDIFMCPADYPYLYMNNEKTNILIGNKRHWRTINKTLCTFLTSKKLLDLYWENFSKNCEDRHDPFEKYINEIYKNEFCISPLKSLSIHLTNVNSSYGLSPFINYKDLWDQNE
ncbi:glycosyltransferase group 2 [Candidatus Pelagibacter sp. RS39]|uniref:glycosyltransferase group 2 n=1 Tax=Candidatus Pelagibacter sp. RS39 TaxID=1977864 RepID=UPI000A14CA6A|nr:glycosyltransferase group 2 [Candidatus Pelagibacter sp. RS39]ARJ47709.1 glycosyltransferase group 2 [Candidatus Pelagibacter sp. RS39]